MSVMLDCYQFKGNSRTSEYKTEMSGFVVLMLSVAAVIALMTGSSSYVNANFYGKRGDIRCITSQPTFDHFMSTPPIHDSAEKRYFTSPSVKLNVSVRLPSLRLKLVILRRYQTIVCIRLVNKTLLQCNYGL